MLNYECKVTSKSPIERELTISIKPESIQKYLDDQFESLQKKIKIDGFRPGKVPLTVIKQRYANEAKAEAFSNLVRDSYLQALEQNKVDPVGQPKIETKSGANLDGGEALVYTAKVEIFPEIKMADLTKLQVKKPTQEENEKSIDDEIEKSLGHLQKNHAEMIPWVDYVGPIKTDDIVQISYTGTIDGKAHDGLKGENRLAKVGSNQYMKDFEDALIGMKKDETKTFTVSFSKEMNDKNVAGKNAEFTVTVHEFKQEQLPEINDEFAKRFKMETVLELRKKIADTIQEGRERENKNLLKQNIFKSLIEAHPFEVPASFIDSQVHHLSEEMSRDLKNNHFTDKMIEDYLEKQKQDLRKRAEDQVRVTLVLNKIAQDQSINIEEADLERAYTKIATEENINLDEVKKIFASDETARRELRFRLKEERTIEYLKSQMNLVT